VVEREIRDRWARIRILQNLLDHMLGLERARALLYVDHPEGSTGLVMKDYRGQKAQKEIWKFDAALATQVLHILKQAAIEVGQWTEKWVPNGGDVLPVPVNVVFVDPPPRDETGVGISEVMRRLNAGRQRVAEDKLRRDAEVEPLADVRSGPNVPLRRRCDGGG
jgi:hypothetical protein